MKVIFKELLEKKSLYSKEIEIHVSRLSWFYFFFFFFFFFFSSLSSFFPDGSPFGGTC
jgi:hypothetical protein